ncbi:MAG TPA: pyridoxal-phosphate dependent enzyme, partial [Flammeovirgaceae bacterium]|nr:pyridoxal-phosphate dependent enzyme [Flammeovirgaceae bacterium]
MMTHYATPDKKELQDTRQRLAPIVHRTPVLTSGLLNKLSGAELYFKCENFQKAGAFKFRGALNAV